MKIFGKVKSNAGDATATAAAAEKKDESKNEERKKGARISATKDFKFAL